MNNISTYKDLLEEKRRLEATLAVQKGVIQQDLLELRQEFKPTMDLLSFVNKMTKRTTGNPLISMGANLVGGMLMKNVVLSGSGKLAKLVIPFIAGKLSSYFVKKNGGTILEKLAGFWNKTKSNGYRIE